MKRTLEHAWRGWSENGGIYGNIWGIYIYIIINLIIYIYGSFNVQGENDREPTIFGHPTHPETLTQRLMVPKIISRSAGLSCHKIPFHVWLTKPYDTGTMIYGCV
jgi:hypothetical protein